MHLVLQAILIVGLSVLLALAVLVLTRRLLPRRLLEQQHQVATTTMQVLGAAYGVLLAFVVVVVWDDFQDADGHAVREAVELAALYRLAAALPAADQQRARDTLVAYARAVVEEEWPAMADGNGSPRARELVEQLWQVYTGMADRAAGNAAYAESLSHLATLGEQRELRLLDARSRLPSIMWVLLIAGGVLTVGGIYFLGIADRTLEAIMTGALAAMIALVLVLISAFDQPFDGSVRVTPDAFELMLQEVVGRS